MAQTIFRRIVFCGILPALMLAGCVGGPRGGGYEGWHAAGKKASTGLVVFRLIGNDLKRVPVRLNWRAFDKQSKQPVSPQRWFEMKHAGNALPAGFKPNSKGYGRYQIKRAKIGHYYLDNMRVREPHDSGPKKVRGKTVYFTVRPGQVVYVGDFKIDYDDQQPEYRLTDDFARAKRYMAKRRDIRRPLRRGIARRIQLEKSDGD
jgi:hypothetical protein